MSHISREDLFKAYLCHLSERPQSPWRGVSFEAALANPSMVFCLRALARNAERAASSAPTRGRPVLTLV